MHTIIRAIAYCAGWVAGLFRRADAVSERPRSVWFYDTSEVLRNLHTDYFGDAHDQVARGDG